jgi:hypothetical protein
MNTTGHWSSRGRRTEPVKSERRSQMETNILGWILIAIGLVSTLAGVAGGIAAMFREIQNRAMTDQAFGIEQLPTEFLWALTEFLKALIQAPPWLALTLIGFALIAWGGRMI